MSVSVEYHDDHLILHLQGASAVSSLRRRIVVPYSDIRDVEVAAPAWPSLIREWRVGTHVPGFVASGLFVAWGGGRRRFLHFGRENDQVLTMRLGGSTGLDEVSVALDAADSARVEISRRMTRK